MAPYSVLAHANSSFLRRQSKSRDNFQNKFCMVNSTGCLDNNITLYCPFVHALPIMFCYLCPHKCYLAVCCILPFSVWPSEVWEPQCCQQAAGNHHHLWETGAGCRGECVCMCVCLVQNTKEPGEPILITEKWRRKIFPRFARTDRHYTTLCRCLLQSAPPTSNIFRHLWHKGYMNSLRRNLKHIPC